MSEEFPSAPLRVLLFSPVPGVDPASGDTSYTQSLLQDPPPGVVYTTYVDAQRLGLLHVRGRKPWGGGRWTAPATFLFILRSLEVAARRCGLLFREPTWFIEVEPDSFDVIHQHLFAVRQLGQRVPVFSSAGYPLTVLYGSRERWSSLHLYLAERLELLWARALRVHNPWLHPVEPCAVSVYSDAARDYLLARGANAHSVRIVSTGIPDLGLPPRASSRVALVFVGRDFHRKGGPLALAAYHLVRMQRPEVTITVVTGAAAPCPSIEGVTWMTDVERDVLLSQVLPGADVLLAPTSSDCGAPYAVLEALQAGLAVVLSELPWLDPRLISPAVRRTSLDARAVADRVLEVLHPDNLVQAQEAAPRLWAEHFSTDQLGQQLKAGYVDAWVKGTKRG